MKLIKLQCPSCGANLKVNDELKSVTCNYCGATTLLDDETIKIEHHIIDDSKGDLIDTLETLVEDKRYDQAFELGKALSEKYPKEPRVWLSLLITLTRNFTKKFNGVDEYYEDKKDLAMCLNTLKKDGFDAAVQALSEKITFEKAFEYYVKYEHNEKRVEEIKQKYEEFYIPYLKAKTEYDKKVEDNKKIKKQKENIYFITLCVLCILSFVVGEVFFSKDIYISLLLFAVSTVLFYYIIPISRKKGFKNYPFLIYLVMVIIIIIQLIKLI